MSIVWLSQVLVGIVLFKHIEGEPCGTYVTIDNEDKRSGDYTFNSTTDNAFTDDRLTKQWYRIELNVGDQMPTYPPGVFKCGTWYPIWLNGSLPTVPKYQVLETVCLQHFTSTCSRSWTINIQYCCGGYYVYELQPSPVIDSGYCFGAKTGYFPQCGG